MIVVEPLFLFCREHSQVSAAEVYRTERERLELEELAELGLHVVAHEDGILYAHAELAGEIETRLVGDGHTRNERCRFPFHPYLVGAFMNIEVASHAVARAVHIVHALAPHCLTGKGVNLGAAGEVGELAEFELYVAL